MHVLVVGNLTRDKVGETFLPGGSVLYCALAYAALGHNVRVLTATDGGWPSQDVFGASITIVEHSVSHLPTFENLYDQAGNREQFVHERGQPLAPPEFDLSVFDWVHLAPVLSEVELAVWAAGLSSARRVVAGLQGWLRRVDGEGRVVGTAWGYPEFPFHLVTLSVEDIVADQNLPERIRSAGPDVALTRGALGSTFLDESEPGVDAFPTNVVDPTGAGDVFAAALAHARWAEKMPAERALRFANAASSIVIEGPGTREISRVLEAYERAGISSQERA